MNQLFAEQKQALQQMKDAVTDIIQPHHDDSFLLTWLRARNFDVQKAEAMYRKSMAWRKHYNVDKIHEEWRPPEVLEKYWQGGLCGFTRDGYPVWYNIAKDFDIKGHMRSSKRSEIIKYHIYEMEKIMNVCQKQSDKLGNRIIGAAQVTDMKDFNLRAYLTSGMDVFRTILAIFEANYPEFLKVAYIINAPVVFPIVYNFFKPFMSEDTKRKIKILGSDWKEVLLQEIDEEELPQAFGGKKTDPDGNPLCATWITYPSEVPKTYYLSEQNLFDQDKTQVVVINRGDSFKKQFHVTQPGTVIRWVFKTRDHDIAFAINHNSTKNGVVEVVKYSRVSSNLIPEEGSLTLKTLGTYTLVFDNSYSWINSKQLTYQVELLEPAEEITEQMSHIDEKQPTAS